MNGLHDITQLKPIIGQILLGVQIGWHQYQLLFDDFIRIAVESESYVWTPSGEEQEVVNYREQCAPLCGLIGSAVTGFSLDGYGGFVVSFDSGASLQITNDSPHYESFQVHIGDEIIVG